MLKSICSILFASILCASSSTYAATSFGGTAGFSRCTLRNGEGTFEELGNPTPGLHVSIPLDPEVQNPDGTLGTWGFEFGVDYVADKDINISFLSQKVWKNWKTLKLIGGTQLGFVDPGDNGGTDIVSQNTRLVGLNGAVRFDVLGVPGEMGGNWSWRYDGMDDVNVSEVHFALVGEIPVN